MSNSKILNLDSSFSYYLYDNGNTANIYLSPYYCEYKLSHIIKKITKVELKSVEIPLLFNNIRTSNIFYTSLNYFAFTYKITTTSTSTTATTNVNTVVITASNSNILVGMVVSGTGITLNPTVTNVTGTTITLSSLQTIPSSTTLTFTLNPTHSFNITENIYNNITSLVSIINSTLSSDSTLISRSASVVLTVNATNKIVITTNLTNFKLLNDPSLYNYPNCCFPFMNKILGFDVQTPIGNNIILTSANRFNLNIDNYLNMILVNIPSTNQNANNLICSFKIPLNSVNGTIYYYFENSGYEQYIENSDVNFVLDKFSIKILDRFGNSINSNGADYSFTLKIQHNI